jgi:uncharacterized protein (TIGR01244 family)
MNYLRLFSRCGLVAAVLLVAAAVLAADGGAVEEIANYVRVTESVSTGGQPTAVQIQALARAHFRAVVNLREDEEYDAKAEGDAARDAGLTYLRIPVKGSSPRDVEADEFLRVTDDAANFPMFIHCASGNRVGAFWLIRRVLRDGMTFEEAEAEARPIGLKSPNLVEFARTYVAGHAGERR